MGETMWAAQLTQARRPLQLTRIAVPRPGAGELLLRLEASGICHTDLHIQSAADFLAGAPQPLTLGHEGIGRVVEAGPGTTSGIGTRLGAPWLHDTCAHCQNCRTGRESFCPGQRAHGSNVQGTFAEYVIVKEAFAPGIPEGLASLAAAPLMCAGITAYGAVERAGLVAGKTVVILGCGGLGQYAIQLARLTGARVIGVDSNPAKLVEARRLGADECVLADAAAGGRIKSLGGADVVLNFAPSNQIWPMITQMVNNFATIVSAAMVADPVPLQLDWLTQTGVNITGTSVGTRQQMRDFLEIAAQNHIAIAVEAVQLADINLALERLAGGNVAGRLVIDFPQG